MARTTTARPATKPVRAVSLCDDANAAANAADDDDAEARRLAGIALRKRTVAATMVYAGLGVRAGERVKATPKKSPQRKSTRKKATEPEQGQSDMPVAPVDASIAPDRRKRSRTQSQLIARFVNAIDGQLDQIDAIMRDPNRGEGAPSDAERHARAVAALARVTVELRNELEAGRRRRADDDTASGRERSADPDRPRDLDELRERLSRRLDIRLAGGPAVPVADDAAGGNRIPE